MLLRSEFWASLLQSGQEECVLAYFSYGSRLLQCDPCRTAPAQVALDFVPTGSRAAPRIWQLLCAQCQPEEEIIILQVFFPFLGLPCRVYTRLVKWREATITTRGASSSRGSVTMRATSTPTSRRSTSGMPCKMCSPTGPTRLPSSQMCKSVLLH